ncbi:hypothetical protein LSTR_LSTR012897 [Laodelphax striatellus]|uniref:DNA-directed RNA polymerase II subunit GRINL1A n=1 Tax=Laodelphax striatellus TaxID=195883 RepID=A0A482WPE9_LAOST|nr:hypothetical protein LSTR_LSTR012897 [Laodelphax striatellus]
MAELSGIFEKVIHKVPGQPVISKKEKQGYTELDKMTKVQLLETIERQNKLLENRNFLNKLPDKGTRIADFKTKLETELKKRNEEERLAEMLSNLNVNGPEELNRLEWTGSCNPGYKTQESKPGNIEDETEVTDPLQLFASHSGTQFNKKIYRVEKPAEPLIKPSDLESDTSKKDPIETVFAEEPYVRNLCEKFDDTKSIKPRERFLPHKTLKTKVETDTKVNENEILPIEKKQKWEVTAATPPPPVHGDTKMLTLTDSVRLQCEQAERLKEIQLKHAVERLKSQRESSRIVVPKDTTGWTYRDKDGSKSSSEDETDDDDEAYHDCEEGDEADEKQGGVVFYNLVDE